MKLCLTKNLINKKVYLLLKFDLVYLLKYQCFFIIYYYIKYIKIKKVKNIF